MEDDGWVKNVERLPGRVGSWEQDGVCGMPLKLEHTAPYSRGVARAYLALGSNLGDRALHLLEALARLSQLPETRLLRLSSVYETLPVGPPQPLYLNQVAELETGLPPEALLAFILEIERALGRLRREKWGPRTLDLDLLLYGKLVLSSPSLTLPHPRLHERAFVLVPLCDLIPEAIHPVLGRSFRALLEGLDTRGVRRVL